MQDLPKPGSENSRDRVLTDKELVQVWRACDDVYGQATKLLILTGARREEIGRLRWDEIVDGHIELRGARTKTGEPRIIPLSAPARAVLDQIHTHLIKPRGEFVFGKRPLADWARAKKRLDANVEIPAWVIHDLRRTAATGLQKLGTSLQVVESILGHTAGSRAGVIGIYQRHDYAAEKASALEAWGAHVKNIVDGGRPAKVLPLLREVR
jgi:integrase